MKAWYGGHQRHDGGANRRPNHRQRAAPVVSPGALRPPVPWQTGHNRRSAHKHNQSSSECLPDGPHEGARGGRTTFGMSALTAGKSVRICVAWPMHTYSLAGASRNDSRRSMAAVLLTEALERAVGTPAPERSLWE